MSQEPNKTLQIITRPENGQLTEKERIAIEMRYLGKTSEEIGSATGYNPAYIRTLFMTRGRLAGAYREYSLRQQTKGQDQADQVLNRVRVEAPNAAERMIALSKDADNEASIFKANEFLLNVAGIRNETTLSSFFQNKSFEQAKILVEKVFNDVYQKSLLDDRTRFIVYTYCEHCGKPTKDSES